MDSSGGFLEIKMLSYFMNLREGLYITASVLFLEGGTLQGACGETRALAAFCSSFNVPWSLLT